jgi:RNA polymerase sigma factor (sigma-70 family)
MSAFVIGPNTPAGCAAASTDSALRLSEGRLVEAAKLGQSTAFVTLCEQCSRRLFRAAHRITRSCEDAEDAVQDALLQAFVHLRDFDGRSSFSTWLTRIAINSALMILRKKRATPSVSFEDSIKISATAPALELSGSDPSPEDFCMQGERKRILSTAMNELTPATREAMQLRYLRELSLQETARVLGVSVTTVKGRVFHGRRKLRQMLDSNDDSAVSAGARQSVQSSLDPVVFSAFAKGVVFVRSSQQRRSKTIGRGYRHTFV